MFDDSPNQIFQSLFDIASNIQIESNFCIYHPNYQPFALPANIANRFQQNSPSLKQKYLKILLRNFLYGIYYNGSLQTVLAANNHSCQSGVNFLENNSLGVDEDFYEQLHHSNYGTGHYEPNWQILRIEPDGSMAVTKDGLTLYIEPECHLQPRKKSPKAGELIAIWMPKNRLEIGCYVEVSNIAIE
jgi:hypothetical protein